MPDPVPAPADARPAPSSSAPVPAAAPEPTIDLDALSPDDLQAWRETGKVPEKTPAPPADPPPAEAVQDQPVSTETPQKPATGAASEPAPAAKGAEARIPELLADRARERERAERAERRLAELERQQQSQPPAPGARPAASPAAPGAPVRPDPDAFPYGTADPGYIEAVADYKVALAIANDRAAREAAEAQQRLREDGRALATAFETKAEKVRAVHPDFDAVALQAPTEIPQGSPTDLWILEDDAGAEILYHLQQPANASERRRILALSPREQLKELVRLGDRLTAPPPAPRSTGAPPPPATLPSRGTAPDPIERALAAGTDDASTRAYMDAANRRDLARLKR